MDKKQEAANNENLLIAGRTFDPSDYEGKSQVSSGLSLTHEQVNDDYYEGTVDQELK
ncbi:DUF4025 domain-containing protein [Bacillus lacus]|uniref:DUF4025 domain-containing protein n=1 Tax=Metabacillus lacus TaxID=1983721 RepID=A0A7X2J0J8_9BACI|nr:DUF4025 domain-containing protein [Metabacillus lacus]